MNWSEFFAMNGYGFYVWGSYGAAFAIFLFEIMMLVNKRKAVLQRLRLMRAAGEEE
jgi:heme exporter protein D